MMARFFTASAVGSELNLLTPKLSQSIHMDGSGRSGIVVFSSFIPQLAASLAPEDKVLDAELSPQVVPVDHGSQRYSGGPVTEAHVRHLRKKAGPHRRAVRVVRSAGRWVEVQETGQILNSFLLLVVTSASLIVTSALLVVTRS